MNNIYNNTFTFRFFLVFLIFIFGKNVIAQTSITGKVTDADTGEDMIAANVMLTKNGVFIQGATTNIDGIYNFKVDAGMYDLEVSYTGYPTIRITEVLIVENQSTTVDVSLKVGQFHFGCGGLIAYIIPLLKQDETSTELTTTSDKIRNLPTRNINGISSITPGVSFTQ